MKYTISVIILAICLLPFFSQLAYSSNIMVYLVDGKDVNGLKIYTVNYVDMLGNKYELTDNSKSVILSDSQAIVDFTLKIPDSNGYSINPIQEVLTVNHIEPISDQLNKYQLKEPVDIGSIMTLTETSPTTAVMDYTLAFNQ